MDVGTAGSPPKVRFACLGARAIDSSAVISDHRGAHEAHLSRRETALVCRPDKVVTDATAAGAHSLAKRAPDGYDAHDSSAKESHQSVVTCQERRTRRLRERSRARRGGGRRHPSQNV